MIRIPTRTVTVVAAALLGAASVTGVTGWGGATAAVTTASAVGVGSALDPSACPIGYLREQDTTLADFAAGRTGSCAPALHTEGAELMTANAQLQARSTAPFASVKAGAAAAAQAQKASIAAQAATPESTAPWTPLGSNQLNSDVATYDRVNGLGLAGLSGRIQSYDHDPADPTHWWAGVSAGGVWETHNSGATWTSIGDTLPTQLVGAIAYDPASGGRLLAATGDPSFGGDAISGLGAYWTANDGVNWTRSTGLPDGTTAFRIAVDALTPSVVYAATGKGLYRSTDAGTSYTNVALPTTCTSTTDPICFFANIVTDVVVQTGSHRVLAAVGWRAGQKLNAQGKPQAPQNGLYTSTDGTPGSFTYINSPAGFATTAQDGRIALGAATGATQNHAFVYALVEDATKFNLTTTSELDIPNPAGMVPNATYLKGLYVSGDFGQTWHLMTGPTQLGTTSGSALVGENSATYAPGIQSWYNEWVAVDPTQATAAGSPTRVDLGLEEIFENQTPLTDTQATAVTNDTVPFKVIGAYFKGTSCAGLNLNLPVCPANVNSIAASTTTHPDQHAAMFVPDASGGGVTLVVGNDGGAYAQHVTTGYGLTAVLGNGTTPSDFDNAAWGTGINNGLHTLQPYQAVMAKDGTVYAGLQDNGNMKITPQGQEIETFGGDGFYAGVDPDDSNTSYEEYTYGDIAVTTDGGQSYTDIAPPNAAAGAANFAAPFLLDPLNAKHIIAGNTQVVETAQGSATASADWTTVFDLGTSPTAAGGTTNNVPSAVDLRGANAYVAYCGYCDIVTGGLPFHSGLATNVGGSAAPAFGSTAGWHMAAGNGLPQRYLTSVKADPADPKTVYVTAGGYGRRWIPPGSLGDDVSKIGTGHVFVSHDAGQNFTDITGNLPDTAADDTVLQNGRLLVATDIGTFIAPTAAGGTWSQLGSGLPAAPVFSLEISPRNTSELVVATYGRGVYELILPPTTATGPTTTTSPTTTVPPVSTPTKKPAPKPTKKPTPKPSKMPTPVKQVAIGTGGVRITQARGTLAFTGLSDGLAAGGLALAGAALLVGRRRRRRDS